VREPAATIPLPASGSRVRPGDPAWPDEASWARLSSAVGGRLIKVASPLAGCHAAADTAACRERLKNLRNPFYVRDHPGATQCSGWADAWMSAPSAYAVAAEGVADVVAAVDFARENNLRLVIKGGGHSYHGTSCAPDSLLIWTRHIDRIVLHDAFAPQGCAGRMAPQPAVEIGAGAIWLHVYQVVTGKGGRFVRGGGCTTVGVAGLVQSGGFGNFPKKFGTAAGSLLEAEIVTADGQVRVVNACLDPDLFWAVKGGGGGTFGVVTKLVMKTYELPEALADTQLTVKAASAGGWQGLAPVPRLDRRVAPGLSPAGAADDRQHGGARLVERGLPSSACGKLVRCRRPSRRGAGRFLVGRRRPGKWRLLAWLSVHLAHGSVARG
jgi:hypothetical protein